MHIGIDARLFGPEQGGLGRYIEQLVLHLEKTNTDDTFTIFLRRQNWDSYIPVNPRFHKVLADIPWYGWKEQLLLSKIFRSAKVDLLHFPHWNVPLGYNEPFIVTIHDLLLMHYPTRAASTLGPLTYWFKQLMYKKVLRHAAKKSQHIIATSEFTKQDIHKTLHIPLEKITTTYQAAFSKPARKETSLNLSSYGITKPYLLYVGVAYPHKNLDQLIKAWEIFCQQTTDYQLVLIGKENFFYQKLQSNLPAATPNKPIFTGFIPDEQLPFFYKNASLYVFPSLYEGFGLPPLEAMSYGLPVAASTSTCLPEILGSAAVFFDPRDPKALAGVLFDTLKNPKLLKQLTRDGYEWCSRYSWEKLTIETLTIYHRAQAHNETLEGVDK